jgi:hypothetical protein
MGTLLPQNRIERAIRPLKNIGPGGTPNNKKVLNKEPWL